VKERRKKERKWELGKGGGRRRGRGRKTNEEKERKWRVDFAPLQKFLWAS